MIVTIRGTWRGTWGTVVLLHAEEGLEIVEAELVAPANLCPAQHTLRQTKPQLMKNKLMGSEWTKLIKSNPHFLLLLGSDPYSQTSRESKKKKNPEIALWNMLENHGINFGFDFLTLSDNFIYIHIM